MIFYNYFSVSFHLLALTKASFLLLQARWDAKNGESLFT